MLVRCTEIAPTAGMLAIRGAVPDIAFVAALTIIAAVILSMLFWVFVESSVILALLAWFVRTLFPSQIVSTRSGYKLIAAVASNLPIPALRNKRCLVSLAVPAFCVAAVGWMPFGGAMLALGVCIGLCTPWVPPGDRGGE
jgi:hypothetical protein